MKFATITGGLLGLSTLSQAAINLTHSTNPDGTVNKGDFVRIAWEIDETLDLMLSFVKKEDDTKKWPLGHRPIYTMWGGLRLDEGKGSFVYNIPSGKVKEGQLYGFYLEGKTIEESPLEFNNLTEWFEMHKWTPPKKEDLKL
ncbi:hypothetical protein D6C78_01933 [Aureobasidium pullulans]|uniref:Uncharacterized protein n=1 Tax=Aureobasidium pullulans TaxID=5580 RepID=A0A4T0C1N5_AURPU|nr:hypothetical protein D6C78_01933 [Aureobasidium pullulans]